ncbi:carbohydrate ABC transporter permease [Nonomuraea fuscirosea]|uniref:carbohydrate ABC transporter permease n=1 Tax=Nonomuraea fuscirosea TaxID=1291556 RepID=UPI0034099D68
MIAVLVSAGFGVSVVLYLAGLQAVPHSLIEAARIDGATRAQVFRNVTLPALGPSVTVNIVLSLVTLLKSYDLVVSLTAGGPAGQTQTVAYLIHAHPPVRAHRQRVLGPAGHPGRPVRPRRPDPSNRSAGR